MENQRQKISSTDRARTHLTPETAAFTTEAESSNPTGTRPQAQGTRPVSAGAACSGHSTAVERPLREPLLSRGKPLSRQRLADFQKADSQSFGFQGAPTSENFNFQPTLSLFPPHFVEGSVERGGVAAVHRSRSGDAASRSASARPRPSKSWRRGRVAGSSARCSSRGRRPGSAADSAQQLEIFKPESRVVRSKGPLFPAARQAWAAVEGQRRRWGKRPPLPLDISRTFEGAQTADSVASSDVVEGLETSLFDVVVLMGSVLLFGSLTWLAV